MKRISAVFKVKPELIEEYKKIHSNIWPEIKDIEKKAGFNNFSMFYRENGTVYTYMEIKGDFDKVMEKLSKSDVHKKWLNMLDRFYIKKEKNTPGAEIRLLEEVYHID